MLQIRRQLIAATLSLLFTASVFAQTATVTRNVNLRPEPSTEEPPIRLLTPPTQLQLLSTVEEDGYYNVRTVEGQEGWVWKPNVSINAGAIAPPRWTPKTGN